MLGCGEAAGRGCCGAGSAIRDQCLTSSSSSALRPGAQLVSYTSRTEMRGVCSSPTASRDQEEARAQSWGEGRLGGGGGGEGVDARQGIQL